MNFSRRLFLTGATGLAAWPWLTTDAVAQLSAHPSNEKDLPPVPPDEPVDGPAFLKCGPMIGHVAHDRAKIWVKASQETMLFVIISDDPQFAKNRIINVPPPTADSTWSAPASVARSATIEIDGLKPATRYYYHLLLEGEA